MAKKTLRRHLIESGWGDTRDADDIIYDLKRWLPEEAPPGPFHTTSFGLGYRAGYRAYYEEILRTLQ